MNPFDSLGASQVSGWDIAIAVLVLVASVIAARIAHRATTRLLGRLEGLSDGVRRGTARAAEWTIILLGLGVALGALGADVQPLQTAAIIVAVLLFLALRGVAGQFVAGILLRTSHPYRVGDHIETGEHLGVVRQVTGFATVIETYDGKLVHVPNLEVASHPIINRSAPGGLRADLEVRAAWDADPDSLCALVRAAVADAPDVLAEPPPATWVHVVEPGRLAVRVKAFHDPALDGDLVPGAIAAQLGRALAGAGIIATVFAPPPPPALTVFTHSPTPARPATDA